jgi:6-pyruvoyltetrahydropterin/6-carboxytetrahydropterin synthase
MITCTRKIQFDAAHRIIGHKNKCEMLHGHRYVIEATFQAKDLNHNLDELGLVIDFGIIKEIFGKWVDNNLDHNTILCIEDQELGNYIASVTSQKIYYIKDNPSVENIAKHLFTDICPQLFAKTKVKIAAIKIYETPNCYAKIT